MTIKITAYRGEHGKPDGNAFQSRLGALSFGTVESAKYYATSPNNRADLIEQSRVIKAELTISNPVMNNPHDPFIDFPIIVSAIGVEKAKTIALEQEGHIANTNNWCELSDEHQCETLTELFDKMGVEAALGELYMDAYPVFDEDRYVQWFREAGFDGLVQGGNGVTAMTPEYKVFDPKQATVLNVIELPQHEKRLESEPELVC